MKEARAVLGTALAVILFASAATADVIVVDPAGGGDYDNIPQATWYATADDTILVMPGTYAVGGIGWPIDLHGDSPTFMSAGGAEVTLLLGNGTCSPFRTLANVIDARMFIIGFTMTSTPCPITRAFESGGLLHFTDNIVQGNDAGLDAMWGGSGLIARNLIAGNGGDGINMYHFFGVIEQNEICYNDGTGIKGVCCEDPTIQQNHIHHNGSNGISGVYYCNAFYNIVEDNKGTGIASWSGCMVEHNIIRGNEVGVGINEWHLGHVNSNDIYDNTDYAISVWDNSSYGPWEFDATGNWWGTTEPTEIAAAIYDCHDDPGIETCIAYDPWCGAPGCEPVPVEATSWGAIKAMFR